MDLGCEFSRVGFHRLTSGYLPWACAHRQQPSVASETNRAQTKVLHLDFVKKKKKMLQVKNEKQKSIFSKRILTYTHTISLECRISHYNEFWWTKLNLCCHGYTTVRSSCSWTNLQLSTVKWMLSSTIAKWLIESVSSIRGILGRR